MCLNDFHEDGWKIRRTRRALRYLIGVASILFRVLFDYLTIELAREHFVLNRLP